MAPTAGWLRLLKKIGVAAENRTNCCADPDSDIWGRIAVQGMKHLSENESQEVLSGLIERLTYDNADNGFCVLQAKLLALHSNLL
jgi:hypothetical protein